LAARRTTFSDAKPNRTGQGEKSEPQSPHFAQVDTARYRWDNDLRTKGFGCDRGCSDGLL